MNVISCFPDFLQMVAYARVLFEVAGILPSGIGNTSAAKRISYNIPGEKVIINTPSDDMVEKLGRHRSANPIEVDNPTAAGEKAVEILRGLGFEAIMNNHPEPEFSEGFMCFVSVPRFDGILFLFWPKYPNPEDLARFRASGEFRPWTDEDTRALLAG